MFPFVRIEETWRLWQKFLDDFARFGEWLATSEKTAALPNSSGVLYTVAKEELKKFEVQIFEKKNMKNKFILTQNDSTIGYHHIDKALYFSRPSRGKSMKA